MLVLKVVVIGFTDVNRVWEVPPRRPLEHAGAVLSCFKAILTPKLDDEWCIIALF